MFARVNAVFGERDNARVIPEEAIVPQSGRQFVIRLVDGPDQDTKIAQRVEVKVGIRRPGRVEITEGLQPGDMVVTAGQQRVQKDGMPVRVMDLSRAAGAASAAASATAVPASAAAARTELATAGGPNPCTAMTGPADARRGPPPAAARRAAI
jgi:membrane fusion protein (multidrug efflux system)